MEILYLAISNGTVLIQCLVKVCRTGRVICAPEGPAVYAAMIIQLSEITAHVNKAHNS